MSTYPHDIYTTCVTHTDGLDHYCSMMYIHKLLHSNISSSSIPCKYIHDTRMYLW